MSDANSSTSGPGRPRRRDQTPDDEGRQATPSAGAVVAWRPGMPAPAVEPGSAVERFGRWVADSHGVREERVGDFRATAWEVEGRLEVVRTTQTVSESSRRSTVPPGPMATYARAELIERTPHDPPKKGSWTLLRAGSLGTEPCGTCSGAGQTTCRNCQGRASVTCSNCRGAVNIPCKPYLQCNMCSGKRFVGGTVMPGDAERRPCPSCHARGYKECPRCRGTGNIFCGQCDGGQVRCGCGNGLVRCGPCKGAGQFHSWVEAKVEHRVQSTVVEHRPLTAKLSKGAFASGGVLSAPWSGEQRPMGAEVYAGFIQQSHEAVAARPPGTVLERATMQLAPAVQIAWGPDGAKRAVVHGTQGRVHAPGARQLHLAAVDRWRSAGAVGRAGMVLAPVLLVALVVAGVLAAGSIFGGGDQPASAGGAPRPASALSLTAGASGTSLRSSLRRGLLVSPGCSSACTVRVRLSVSRAEARSARLPRTSASSVTVGRGRSSAVVQAGQSVRVPFSAAARRRLRGQDAVRVIATISARSGDRSATGRAAVTLRGR